MKNSKITNTYRNIYLVGGGIASLASAAYFIRDGKIPGDQITIFEEQPLIGGSLDGSGCPEDGYVLRGGRMLNFSYVCTYDLFSFIPSLNNPAVTVYDEIIAFNQNIKTHANARVISDGLKVDVTSMDFCYKDRLDLIEMMAISEENLGTKQINEWFDPRFFETNFWYMWDTMFAFQPWHSAVEFKRYLHRFIHEFERISTLSGVDRTPFNQFDSLIRPLTKWLTTQGVKFEMGAEVTKLDFRRLDDKERVERIYYKQNSIKKEIELSTHDLAVVTIGSMTADSSLGSRHTPPDVILNKAGGSWKLWHSIAERNPQFGNPAVFDSHVEQSKWESFTVTCQGTDFFDLMEKFTGNVAGTGGLVTFKDSNWLMSVVLPHQPHFIGQPNDITVFWGYGLFPNREGNFVRKSMKDCTGAEIMTELLSHLHFNDMMNQLLKTSNCIPCMLPYITSQFLVREKGDRPLVVPEISHNLAFIGQFVEVPDDVVFTVEYSVRTAQTAVYTLLGLDKQPTPIYKGGHNLGVLFDAAKTLLT